MKKGRMRTEKHYRVNYILHLGEKIYVVVFMYVKASQI